MRNQKGKKIGLHMLTAALFFVLAMSVCTVKTEAKDYKQGKVYKITAKSKPLKASKFTKSSLYNKKTRMYFTIRSYMEKFQKRDAYFEKGNVHYYQYHSCAIECYDYF